MFYNNNIYILVFTIRLLMIRFIKKVSKFGKIRRVIEVPRDYYKVIKVGQKVIVEVKGGDGD